MGDYIRTLVYSELVDANETTKAFCFLFAGDDGVQKIYLPKSQVEDIRETANEVDIPEWLVEAKDLEDFLK